MIWLIGCHIVSYVQLTILFQHRLRIHNRIKITTIEHRLIELLNRCSCQQWTVHNRSLTHLMRIGRQTFFRFRRRIRRGGVIDMQLQLPETENLRILLLLQVLGQVGRGLFVRIRHHHFRLVEQVLIFRHVLGCTTTAQQQQNHQNKWRKSSFQYVMGTIPHINRGKITTFFAHMQNFMYFCSKF